MWNLAGVLGAIIISAILMTSWSGVIQTGQNRTIYAAAASEYQDLLGATQRYVETNASQISTWIPVGGSTWFSTDLLVNANYLPPGFSQTNPFGQGWGIWVRQPQAGQIQAYVMSFNGTALGLPALTSVVGMAGQQSGYVPPDNVLPSLNSSMAIGNMGKWRMSLAGIPNPGPGHFFGQATMSSTTQVNSDVLYRDNVPNHPEFNTMNAPLNMGGNNVNNVGNGQFNGRIGTSGVDPNSVPPGWIGGVATFDVSARGTIGAGGANQNPAAWINSSGNGGFNGSVSIGQNLNVGNAITANNVHVASGNNLWVGNNTVYGDGLNLALRTNGTAYVQHQDGSAANLIAGDITGNRVFLPSGETIYMGSGALYGDWQNLALRPNGGRVYIQNRNGGDADLYARQFEAVTGVHYDQSSANPGYSCAPNGLVSAKFDGSGEILACVNGSWKSVLNKQINVYVPPTTNGFGGYASVNPATGGFSCQSGTNDTFGATLWYGDYGYSVLHVCEPQ